MRRFVFLVEEPSMAAFLESWIPLKFPELSVQMVPHEGKSDLLRSIPRKLRAWREPGVSFVVLIDNDGADCVALKRRIVGLCKESGRSDTLVRIVCQELEAWYIGDSDALALAFNRQYLIQELNRSKFRDPDNISKPSEELKRLIPEFQKISGARQMGACLDPKRNRSGSFSAFVNGIGKLASG